jgi:hypothetical protein
MIRKGIHGAVKKRQHQKNRAAVCVKQTELRWEGIPGFNVHFI